MIAPSHKGSQTWGFSLSHPTLIAMTPLILIIFLFMLKIDNESLFENPSKSGTNNTKETYITIQQHIHGEHQSNIQSSQMMSSTPMGESTTASPLVGMITPQDEFLESPQLPAPVASTSSAQQPTQRELSQLHLQHMQQLPEQVSLTSFPSAILSTAIGPPFNTNAVNATIPMQQNNIFSPLTPLTSSIHTSGASFAMQQQQLIRKFSGPFLTRDVLTDPPTNVWVTPDGSGKVGLNEFLVGEYDLEPTEGLMMHDGKSQLSICFMHSFGKCTGKANGSQSSCQQIHIKRDVLDRLRRQYLHPHRQHFFRTVKLLLDDFLKSQLMQITRRPVSIQYLEFRSQDVQDTLGLRLYEARYREWLISSTDEMTYVSNAFLCWRHAANNFCDRGADCPNVHACISLALTRDRVILAGLEKLSSRSNGTNQLVASNQQGSQPFAPSRLIPQQQQPPGAPQFSPQGVPQFSYAPQPQTPSTPQFLLPPQDYGSPSQPLPGQQSQMYFDQPQHHQPQQQQQHGMHVQQQPPMSPQQQFVMLQSPNQQDDVNIRFAPPQASTQYIGGNVMMHPAQQQHHQQQAHQQYHHQQQQPQVQSPPHYQYSRPVQSSHSPQPNAFPHPATSATAGFPATSMMPQFYAPHESLASVPLPTTTPHIWQNHPAPQMQQLVLEHQQQQQQQLQHQHNMMPSMNGQSGMSPSTAQPSMPPLNASYPQQQPQQRPQFVFVNSPHASDRNSFQGSFPGHIQQTFQNVQPSGPPPPSYAAHNYHPLN